MKFAIRFLILLTATGAHAGEPIACEQVKAGTDIEIEYGTEPLYDLDSAPGFARLWGGKVSYNETTILHPFLLKSFDTRPGVSIKAHVLRDGFKGEIEGGGQNHESCNIVVKIGDKNILLRKSRVGNDKQLLTAYVSTLENIKVIEQPSVNRPKLPSVADLSFNGAAR